MMSLPYTMIWTTSTDANRPYSFLNLDEGAYTISASKANYTSCSANPVERTLPLDASANLSLSKN